MPTPTTSKTPTPPTLPDGVTKLCHIVKRADFDGYGFNLHSEKIKPGQFIGKVDANSPAEAAGLKEGDRILEVNGVSIGSETHKQVVARIKAIANEVRLLLIDVDGKANEIGATAAAKAKATAPAVTVEVAAATSNGNTSSSSSTATTPDECGIKQEMPGASANISSISMVSTKRSSTTSSIRSGSTTSADVVDKAATVATTPTQNGLENAMNELNLSQTTSKTTATPAAPTAVVMNHNNLMSTPPPPPSAQVATVNNINNNNNNNNNNNHNNNGNGNGNVYGNGSNGNAMSMTTPTTPPAGINRAGSLNLPLTAAEMRAKLASKKKYDPKNESVDLKKKFDIIQKL